MREKKYPNDTAFLAAAKALGAFRNVLDDKYKIWGGMFRFGCGDGKRERCRDAVRFLTDNVAGGAVYNVTFPGGVLNFEHVATDRFRLMAMDYGMDMYLAAHERSREADPQILPITHVAFTAHRPCGVAEMQNLTLPEVCMKVIEMAEDFTRIYGASRQLKGDPFLDFDWTELSPGKEKHQLTYLIDPVGYRENFEHLVEVWKQGFWEASCGA